MAGGAELTKIEVFQWNLLVGARGGGMGGGRLAVASGTSAATVGVSLSPTLMGNLHAVAHS